jgi:hypothetical protein
MIDMTMGVLLLLLTGFLWFAGAVLHWHNIRRQERLLLRMRRISARRRPAARRAAAARAEPAVVGESLRPAERWSVG